MIDQETQKILDGLDDVHRSLTNGMTSLIEMDITKDPHETVADLESAIAYLKEAAAHLQMGIMGVESQHTQYKAIDNHGRARAVYTGITKAIKREGLNDES